MPGPTRKRYRPISPSDTAATTGLAVNPNGTQIAIPSALPQVNVTGGSPPSNNTVPKWMQWSFDASQPLKFTQYVPGFDAFLNSDKYQAGQNRWTTYATRKEKEAAGEWYTPPNPPTSPASTVIQNLANPHYQNPDFSSFSPETQAAIAQLSGQTPAIDETKPYGGFSNTGGADNTDYANTAAAQYYEATGTPFLQQKRWDGKKFVTLDRYFKQQKKAKRNDKRRQQQAKRNPQANDGYTASENFINFNTSTG